MRHTKTIVLVLALAACIFVACKAKDDTVIITDELDKAVGEAILKDSEGSYRLGECVGEGHIIMGTEQVFENEIKVYALTMYGEYGFVNGEFNKISGTGCIPEVLTFSTENGYEVVYIEYPKDGNLYVKSIKELFPSEYEKRAIQTSKEDDDELTRQEREYAKEYLEKIGRADAKIVDYSERTLLTEVGVSVDVSNKILELQTDLLANYPSWNGNLERIEDGVRYIYEMKYNEEESRIEYSKIEELERTVVEWIFIDSKTGDLIDRSK